MEMVKKWFDLLEFPTNMWEEFNREIVSRRIELSLDMNVSELVEKKDYQLNLMYCLAQCESAFARFSQRGIPEEYFWANAGEIVVEAIQCRANYGVVGIDDIRWVDLFL